MQGAQMLKRTSQNPRLDNSWYLSAASADYARAHERWLRHAGGEAQCAFEGAVTAVLRPGLRILDVACGTGTLARRLMKSVEDDLNLVLLDNSHMMLASCADIRARRVQGCMKDLPFATDSFDLLTCAWGIEAVSDWQTALRELVRVTRSGGHVFLVHCADRPSASLIAKAMRHHIVATGKGNFLDHGDLCEQARLINVKKVQSLHCGGPAAAMMVRI